MRKRKTISKILKLKDNKKKEVEIEVKKAYDRVDEEHARLEGLEKDYEDNRESLNECRDIKEVNLYYSLFSSLNNKIEKQKEVCSESNNDLKILKGELVNAHKDQKMFEIMKDKAVKKEKKEREDAERKETDFFTISRKLR